MSSKQSRIEELEKLVRHHNKKYFIDNVPEISDEEFDKLSEELRRLNPASPVLFEIVGEIGEVEHPKPMLSIEKKFSYEAVCKWIIDTGDTHYIVEPKYDGMAARCQSGVLSTRGNGYFGEDISERLPHLNIIGKLPKNNTSVFGEVTIPISYFNENLAEAYKNPRNAVVGIIKSKRISAEGIKALMDHGVHFVIYDNAKSLKIKASDLLTEAKWNEILEQMFQTDYLLDGVVIKVADPSLREKLGTTQHHEKWQIAYKSPAERKWSKVVDIKDQVGRTGRVTSVAVINPIELSGATISNITLHNFDFVKKSGIGIGSKVEVCRSGEVIPFIIQVIPANKPHNTLAQCPICTTQLKLAGKYLECPNFNCPARRAQSIEYFFKTLGVEELGLKTIEKFINEFKLNSVLDFYHLDENAISKLDGFGAKSAQKIIQNIQNTLNQSIKPEQLLQALGIKETGPATSRWIINKHGFLSLPNLTVEDLENVKGIGAVKAKHFINEVKEKWPIVESLLALGLNFKIEKNTNKLNGLTFAITGKKEQYSRDELVEMVNNNGGLYKTSVTQDLDYLIAGDEGGSKLVKAEAAGVKIITERDFLAMLR